jgi:hypothetical protein
LIVRRAEQNEPPEVTWFARGELDEGEHPREKRAEHDEHEK